MDQYIGKMLDNRYEILERIGTGGMAVVYKAKCHRLNRLVAVKILKSDLAQDEDFRRRFNAESQAVAQLSHPNIVSVYDVSRGGDMEYIVMELIDGITLKQYMEKRGQLNWRESLHFITQIMRGLSHAHSRGIVHRDIKPQNIMVLRDGSVKVADFGIACLENSAQTLTQEALGSVHYISPEQARGDRTDARSDIYSSGVVLYEMLTGHLPFEGDSAVSVAIQHLSSIPLAPREVNPEIPEQLELICMKAMAPDLDRRYASAEEMIADLEAFRKNPDINLDFELEDLRPEEIDEPTRSLRTHGSTPLQPHRTAVQTYERDRRRERYDNYDESRRTGKTQSVLIGVVIVLAIAVAFALFRTIMASFGDANTVDQYVVPSVLGETAENALLREDISGIFTIAIEEDTIFSDEYPEGTIARQEPEAGSNRKADAEIKVWISAGKDTGVMQNVIGQTVAQAGSTLKSLKEKYDLEIVEAEERQYSAEYAENYIIATIPAENQPLNKGDTITLIVSKGPQPSAYITVVNMKLEDARNNLDSLGFSEVEITEEYSDQPAGYVIRQDPDPTTTTELAPGTRIHLVVSLGPEIVEPQTETLIIPLPPDERRVTLQVLVDGQELLNKRVYCEDYAYNYPMEVTGTGTVMVQVYIDGTLVESASGPYTFGNV